MMSKLIRESISESISFERGGDPRRSMNVGKLERLKKKYDEEWLDMLLIDASKAGNLADVKFLSQQKEYEQYFSKWALSVATIRGYLDVVKYLVEEQNTDVFGPDDLPLIWAARDGHLDVVKYLVERGSDLSAIKLDVIENELPEDVVDYLKSKMRNE